LTTKVSTACQTSCTAHIVIYFRDLLHNGYNSTRDDNDLLTALLSYNVKIKAIYKVMDVRTITMLTLVVN
jgi:hypothetical protein